MAPCWRENTTLTGFAPDRPAHQNGQKGANGRQSAIAAVTDLLHDCRLFET
jgi:hypothetical protein